MHFESLFAFFAFPVKNVTVMGIIGKTQGVKSAARPARKAMSIKLSSE
jgi:hypothetical protein